MLWFLPCPVFCKMHDNIWTRRNGTVLNISKSNYYCTISWAGTTIIILLQYLKYNLITILRSKLTYPQSIPMQCSTDKITFSRESKVKTLSFYFNKRPLTGYEVIITSYSLNGLALKKKKQKQNNPTSRLEVLTKIFFLCLAVDFLADLYIHGETTFTIEGNSKMKTVTVNRTQFLLSEEALSAFEMIHYN